MPIMIVKADGERESWDPGKLERSLVAARATKAVAREIIGHIEKDLRDGMRTWDIYAHAHRLLKRYHRPAAARYSLKRAIMQLGPSGFPFERFVAEILRGLGYATSVGVMVKGVCVEHEVDIVAEKEGERILVEAKYHNRPEMKTDVKVALYVDARFRDIERRIEGSAAGIGYFTRAWLITNTSFTTQAIRYASCSGLALTGWNHPKGRTLQDLVELSEAHPVTCLTTLTGPQKSALLEKGLVMCRNIVNDPDALIAAGIPPGRVGAVLHEGKALCVPQAAGETGDPRKWPRPSKPAPRVAR